MTRVPRSTAFPVLYCVALTSGLGPRPACLQANDLNYSLYEQRLADLESEVAFLRDLQKQKHEAPYQTCDDWYSCQPAHLDFGAELAFLAPDCDSTVERQWRKTREQRIRVRWLSVRADPGAKN